MAYPLCCKFIFSRDKSSWIDKKKLTNKQKDMQQISTKIRGINNDGPVQLDYVVVSRAVLIETIIKNRDEHEKIYNEAVENYWKFSQQKLESVLVDFEESVKCLRKKVESSVEDRLKKVRTKQQPQRLDVTNYLDFNKDVIVPFPENHLQEYNKVIKKLEMSMKDEIELSDFEFTEYVMNDWNWNKKFIENVQNFTSGLYNVGSVRVSGMFNG